MEDGVAQSLNTKVEYVCKATSFAGLATYGQVMIGDRAFEFYNERNVDDFIQIPWGDIKQVAASVMFGGKTIPRFAVFTTAGETPFSFSTKDNKATLRAMRAHLSEEQLVRSPDFLQVMGMGVKGLFKKRG